MMTPPEQRIIMLRQMQDVSNAFYRGATAIGCHPFIEFCGLLNEYIKMCQEAHAAGVDFTETSAHSGKPLPMQTYEAAYIGEKLGCIYGPSLQLPANAREFLAGVGLAFGEPLEIDRKRVGQ